MKKFDFKNNIIYKNIVKTGIRRTFIVFMLIATLLPLSIGGITSYMISKQTIQEEVSDFNKAWISKQKDYLELLLQEIEAMMENIANLDSIKNALDSESVSTDNYTNLSTQATIGYILSGYNIKGLVSIDLLSNGGAHYHVGDTLNFQDINQNTKDKLYKLALASPNSIAWAGLEENINKNSTDKEVISAVKLIKKIDPTTLKEIPVGMIIINYSLDVFYEHFANSNFNANSTLMIVDNERDILFHTDKANVEARADATFISRLTGQDGAFIEALDGQDMFVVYNNSKQYGWTVLSYIPVNKLTENARPIIFYTIAVALLCLLLISTYALSLSRKVLTPINQITMMFKGIGEDQVDLNTRLVVKSQDEIGELVKWFNSFLENMAEKKIVEEELKVAYEELESRVKERTNEIQETLEKLRATQNQLIQREKLAGIGQLAAGIAHEINNPLGFVSSNMSSLQNYLDSFKELLVMYQNLRDKLETWEDQDIKETLENIVKYETENSLDYILSDLDELFIDVNTGLERVGKIVKSLRMFTWMDKEAVYEEAYDLKRGVENSLIMAQNEIKYVAEVEQDLGDVPLIAAIGNEINQVLLNFIVNAAHAIKTKESDTMGLIKITAKHDEEYVYCSIQDNGIGITAENLKQIFNPFFTTKSVGEGTGLGLSISYDIIVNQHHGEILAESELGVGTKFTIKLPIEQHLAIEHKMDTE